MIAAFDVGIRNFAFAVKDKGDFVLLQNICLIEDYMTKTDLNNCKKEELVKVMSDLGITSLLQLKKKEMVDLIMVKLKKRGKSRVKEDVGLNLFKIMDSYKDTWNGCDIFLIERQVTVNMQALKLSHYLEAYLKINYPFKKVLNYSASKKTKQLGGTDLRTKRARKKWTIQYVSELLDGENLRYFQSLKKQDDIADVVCMIEAYTFPPKAEG